MKNWICEGLGLYFGGVGRGLGRVLEPLGVSWAVLGLFFCMLVFGVVFKSALGGIRAGFCFDFVGLGWILGGFWVVFGMDFRGFWVILGCSELFCLIGAF